MVQFCARWAGKIQIESDDRAEHPPLPIRIQYSILFAEMWCREVGVDFYIVDDGRNSEPSISVRLPAYFLLKRRLRGIS